MTESRTGHIQHEHASHRHGPGCGHRATQHGDHVDYVHDGHRHAEHNGHYDEHEMTSGSQPPNAADFPPAGAGSPYAEGPADRPSDPTDATGS